MLTKLDIAAIRSADDLCVHLTPDMPAGKVRLIKRKRLTERDPFATDVEHVLSAPVYIETLRGREAFDAGGVTCFAMVGLYHSQHTTASALLRSLRAGDVVHFAFYPDAHSNGYCAMSGLHADALIVHVMRDGRTIGRWELDVSICPANSARMCRGVPSSEDYHRSAREARAVA